jgi:hypothetical protein
MPYSKQLKDIFSRYIIADVEGKKSVPILRNILLFAWRN